MARDYKNSGKRKSTRGGVPGWLWLVAGFGLGLLAAVLIYLQDVPLPRPAGSGDRSAVQATRPPAKEAAAKPAKAKQELQFEFYTLLPESEVVIPEQELSERTESGSAPERPPGSYMLQAGSFRKQQQAEALKGELALVGIVANVQRVDVDGDTWYRVRVGPFESYDDITRARDRLQDNNINAIAVKVKG